MEGIRQDRHRLIAIYANKSDPEAANGEQGEGSRGYQDERADSNRALHEAGDRRALRALQQPSLREVHADNTPVDSAARSRGITQTRSGAIVVGRVEGLLLVLTSFLSGLASRVPRKDPVGEPWRHPLVALLPRVAGEVTLVVILITAAWLVIHLH